jgi:hypothetical protein
MSSICLVEAAHTHESHHSGLLLDRLFNFAEADFPFTIIPNRRMLQSCAGSSTGNLAAKKRGHKIQRRGYCSQLLSHMTCASGLEDCADHSQEEILANCDLATAGKGRRGRSIAGLQRSGLSLVNDHAAIVGGNGPMHDCVVYATVWDKGPHPSKGSLDGASGTSFMGIVSSRAYTWRNLWR